MQISSQHQTRSQRSANVFVRLPFPRFVRSRGSLCVSCPEGGSAGVLAAQSIGLFRHDFLFSGIAALHEKLISGSIAQFRFYERYSNDSSTYEPSNDAAANDISQIRIRMLSVFLRSR